RARSSRRFVRVRGTAAAGSPRDRAARNNFRRPCVERLCFASAFNTNASTLVIMPSLSDIVVYIDRFLRIRDVGDWDNALNGLQIENSGRVRRIGAAVDVSTRVLTDAGKKNVDFLIVHHGLFWPGLQPVTRLLRRQLQLAFETDMALYGV